MGATAESEIGDDVSNEGDIEDNEESLNDV